MLSKLYSYLRPTTLSSINVTLTSEGKKRLVANHVMQLQASVYMEEVKARFIHKKSLSSKEFAQAHAGLETRLKIMREELEYMKEEYEKIGTGG
jgi:hypothetical protein